jgi:hypothetical protein
LDPNHQIATILPLPLVVLDARMGLTKKALCFVLPVGQRRIESVELVEFVKSSSLSACGQIPGAPKCREEASR